MDGQSMLLLNMPYQHFWVQRRPKDIHTGEFGPEILTY